MSQRVAEALRGSKKLSASDMRDLLDPGVDCQAADDGKTRQEFAEEADINILMDRYKQTGIPPALNADGSRLYLDVSDVPDFMTAHQIVIDANNAFMALNADARAEFQNDPAKFMEFVSQGKNDEYKRERLREWGLLEPEKVEPPPQKVEVVNKPLDEKPA